MLTDIMRLKHTAVIYESPLRVADTLEELASAGAGARPAVVARELTKKFEEFARGSVADLAARFGGEPARGEIVILIGAAPEQQIDENTLRDVAREMQTSGVSAREIQDRLMNEHGASRNVAYRLAHEE